MLNHFAAPLHPDVEQRTGKEQEEDGCYEDPGQRVRLMEVTPREDHCQSNEGNAYHLALEGDAYRTPARIERDGEFPYRGKRE